MIFPPMLGQSAASNVWIALVGFVLTAVLLPIFMLLALSYAEGDFQQLANRVHPWFGFLFAIFLCLLVPLLIGHPRTGTVAYEIGVVPLLRSSNLEPGATSLFVFTLFFFGLVAWFALRPDKLMHRVGQLLCPILLAVITIMTGKALLVPISDQVIPVEAYAHTPFIQGFVDGYQTLDALMALIFGATMIAMLRELGASDRKSLVMATFHSGTLTAILLIAVYAALAYLGRVHAEHFSAPANGGELMVNVMMLLWGAPGNVLLGAAVLLACLTTAVSITVAVGTFFTRLVPAASYRVAAIVFNVFTLATANLGLTQIIKITIPIVMFIYPLAIMLGFLSFYHEYYRGSSAVYISAIVSTALVSLINGLDQSGISVMFLTDFMHALPLYEEGLGWLIPAFIGIAIGVLLLPKKKETIRNSVRGTTNTTV